MPIETDCPGCARRLRVAEEFAGRQARCPICSHIYTVPSGAVAAVGAGAGAAMSCVAGQSFPEAAPPNDFGSRGFAASVQSSTPTSSSASSAVNETADWWLRTPEGVSYGPVTRSAMNRWVSEGRVTSDCMLRNADNAWEPADRRYPQLREASRAGSLASPTSRPATGFAAPDGGSPHLASHGGVTATGRLHDVAFGRPSYQTPHRGTTILIMAVIGLVMGCPILSVIAWVMGSADIREIEAGRMDREGLSTTKAGYLIGMVYSLIWIGMALLGLPLFFAITLAGSL